MRLCQTRLYLLLSLVLLFIGTIQGQKSSPPPILKWAAKLNTYGSNPPQTISNKQLFKDFTLSKLEALDPNIRIRFISNDVVVVYHTKEEGKDWRTASRQLEAFFISAKDGRLLSKREWPTEARRSGSDLLDSESRLIPLSDGRFLVFANHTMLLYGSNLELLRQKKLEPSTSGDLWSAQSVASGHKIFLRHQSASEQQTVYFWIDPDTLLPLAQMFGPQGKNFSTAVTAGDDFVLTVPGLSGHGMTIRTVTAGLDVSTKIICSDELCGEGGWLVLSSSRIAISGRHGIGVVDTEKGLLWSQQIASTANPNEFQFGDIETAMSGNRFGIWMTAYHKTLFDGI